MTVFLFGSYRAFLTLSYPEKISIKHWPRYKGPRLENWEARIKLLILYYYCSSTVVVGVFRKVSKEKESIMPVTCVLLSGKPSPFSSLGLAILQEKTDN